MQAQPGSDSGSGLWDGREKAGVGCRAVGTTPQVTLGRWAALHDIKRGTEEQNFIASLNSLIFRNICRALSMCLERGDVVLA